MPFTADDISARVRARPIRPFRIVTSSGESVDVRHPDFVMVGERELVVGLPHPRRPHLFFEKTLIARTHITALEDLAPPRKD